MFLVPFAPFMGLPIPATILQKPVFKYLYTPWTFMFSGFIAVVHSRVVWVFLSRYPLGTWSCLQTVPTARAIYNTNR